MRPELAEYAGPGVAEAWAKAEVDTKKRIVRLLGMTITICRIGPGNGASYDPASVDISWRAA